MIYDEPYQSVMAVTIDTAPPSGFRDFIGLKARQRLHLMQQIASVYQSFGFHAIETPVLEQLNILFGANGGEENEKLIFKVLKRGEKLQEALSSQNDSLAELGLRFDLTVPLCRLVAQYRNQIVLPWKVFHMGPVWRAERAQKGRFREFIQCDVDIIGGSSEVSAEIEVIQAAVTAFQKVGASGFHLHLNDRRWVQSIAEKSGLTGSKLDTFAILLDKKDKLTQEKIIAQMQEKLETTLSSEIIRLVEGRLTLSEAESFHPEAISGLHQIKTTLEQLQLPLKEITFDPSLIRGMGYYTGPIFELKHASAGYSFGGGGRYDRLIGRFCGQEIPACGFSIGFERLALFLSENQKKRANLDSTAESNTLFIPVFNEKLRPHLLKLASELREQNIDVDVYPGKTKIKNQFRFASESCYRWVFIAGEEEWNSKSFKLKDFQSGEEVTLQLFTSCWHLAEEIKRKIYDGIKTK